MYQLSISICSSKADFINLNYSGNSKSSEDEHFNCLKKSIILKVKNLLIHACTKSDYVNEVKLEPGVNIEMVPIDEGLAALVADPADAVFQRVRVTETDVMIERTLVNKNI